MKIAVGIFSREEFVSGLGIRFDGKIILRTNENLEWMSPDQKKEHINQFIAVVDSLIQAGYELENPTVLKEIKGMVG